MVYPRRRSLWSLINTWHDLNPSSGLLELGSGTILITSPEIALDVLRDQNSYLLRESGFFRTANYTPLPGDQLLTISADLKRILRDLAPPTDAEVLEYFHRNPLLTSQDWGLRYIYWYYSSLIWGGRNDPELRRVADFYFERLILRSSILGKLPPTNTRDFKRACATATRVLDRHSGHPDSPRDLGDLAKAASPPLRPSDVGELFLRLVLSLVGFTGIALEWLPLHMRATKAANEPAGAPVPDMLAFFLEAQRRYPTAWRLVRTPAVEHQIGGHTIERGQPIVLPTVKYHNDPEHWVRPDEFSPERWSADKGARSRYYFPFGYGQGACPGRSSATDTLTRTFALLTQHFDVRVSRTRARNPYVLSLLAPGRTTVRLVDKICG